MTTQNIGNLDSESSNFMNAFKIYSNQGRWDEAEKPEVQVMKTRKTKLGVDHPDTLTSMNNLAFTWKGNGKEIEAVSLVENCVRISKPCFRVDHPHSISSGTDTWKAKQ